MNALLSRGALELAGLLRQRAVSSRELIDAHIARIDRVNPALNAVIAERFDLARKEADAADARLASHDDLPPLCGLPCTVKETFSLEGFPISVGSIYRKDLRAKEDAVAVARIRAAGAIPLGVTNVPEMAMWMETSNLVYGRTNNPYDLRRTPGGSSGGEAAIISAGGSPFAIGSDIGGSIRIPSFFCGLFGHKSTGGLVPLGGQHPTANGMIRRYCVAGPISRRAEDLLPLLRIVAGPDGDPFVIEQPLPDAPRSLAGRRVLRIDRLGGPVKDADIKLRSALSRAAAALSDAGAEVEPFYIDELKEALYIWSAMLDAVEEQPSFHQLIGKDLVPPNLALELLRWLLGMPNHTFPAIALAALEKLAALAPRRMRRYVERGRVLKAKLVAALSDGALLLIPPHPHVAPRHHAPLLHLGAWTYTSIFNVLELPATVVPTGLDPATGMPLGVQVVGAPGADSLTIGAAVFLQAALGGYVPPPSIPAAR